MSLKYGEIIKQMSLEEKALMMSGKNTWETVDFEKYGIPSMAMSDGPHGLRRQAGAGAFRQPVSRPQLRSQTAGMKNWGRRSVLHLQRKR